MVNQEVRTSVWVYGVNDHLPEPEELPEDFEATGFLRHDIADLCKSLNVIPHHIFKIKAKPPPPPARKTERRPSKVGLHKAPEPQEPPTELAEDGEGGGEEKAPPPKPPPEPEEPLLAARSVLVDRISLKVLSLVLPSATQLEVMCFSNCRLDIEMLQLLRRGLKGSCKVAALQLDWNALDLPMPKSRVEGDEEESEADAGEEEDGQTGERIPGETPQRNVSSKGSDAPQAASGAMAGLSHWQQAALDLENRERQRYLEQSQRTLRAFRERLLELIDKGGRDESSAAPSGEVCNRAGDGKISDAADGRGEGEAEEENETADPRCVDCSPIWEALESPLELDHWEKLLTPNDFRDAIVDRVPGVSSEEVAELFDVLDGPDYAAGTGSVSLASLRDAVEGLPPGPPEEGGPEDPIGGAFASFFDGECCLESLSLRSCSITTFELGAISAALCSCPWQLRCLNLWDNRIGNGGCVSLAAGLEVYRGLEFLGLGRNRITDSGLMVLCTPFHSKLLNDEAVGVFRTEQAAKQKAAEAEAKAKAKADPKSKAKGKDAKDEAEAEGHEQSGDRGPRQPIVHEDICEEQEDGGVLLQRKSELKTLNLSENPIKNYKVLEKLQPLGPQGVELVLRCTVAASDMLTNHPEIGQPKAVRRPSKVRAGMQSDEPPPVEPAGPGWLLRLS